MDMILISKCLVFIEATFFSFPSSHGSWNSFLFFFFFLFLVNADGDLLSITVLQGLCFEEPNIT